jgi:hypothetical protein
MRRVAAVGALGLAAAGLILAVVAVFQEFPRGLAILVAMVVAAVAAWNGLLRQGAVRVAGLAVGVVLLVVAAVLVLTGDRLLEGIAIVACLGLSVPLGRFALSSRAALVPVSRPTRPVVIWNPRSGDGKAARANLEQEARSRGITPVELRPGDDLQALALRAIDDGADALAMAGGDGSQAIVAAIAAAHDLPFAIIPAGTRNHLARDVGVDREEVVEALDALVDGGERRVDMADVNGRVFVNNVSLGLYADAVQQPGYREAKLRTIVDAIPGALGPGAHGSGLRFDGPDRQEVTSAGVVLVSNNGYRLGKAIGSGTRPRVDEGVLGMAVVEPAGLRRPWRQWTTPELEIRADGPVPAGIDGEAAVLTPPLHFRSRPGVLRLRIAPQHPGVSPSVALPERSRDTAEALLRVALGREAVAPEPAPAPREPAIAAVVASPSQRVEPHGGDDGPLS